MNKPIAWLDALEDMIGCGDKPLNTYDTSGTPMLGEEEMKQAHGSFYTALRAFLKAEKGRQAK